MRTKSIQARDTLCYIYNWLTKEDARDKEKCREWRRLLLKSGAISNMLKLFELFEEKIRESGEDKACNALLQAI